MSQIDFLSIGDITIDDFIKLKEARVERLPGKGTSQLCVSFGDKIEYELHKVVYAVANSANAAVSAARLGLSSAFATDLGDDRNGRECKAELERNGVMTDFVRIHENMQTNYHYALWYGSERTILIKHQPYPYKFPMLTIPPRWIYLSSVGGESLAYHQEIGTYVNQHPEVQLAFQPGTFQMRLSEEVLEPIYRRTAVFFCNIQEAQRILGSQRNEPKALLQGIRNLGPRIAVITDGVAGAYAYDGTESWFIPSFPTEAYEATGAGDAFSSTFTVALALGKSVSEALTWSSVNAASVVRYIGAREGLLTRDEIEKALSEAPTEFIGRKI